MRSSSSATDSASSFSPTTICGFGLGRKSSRSMAHSLVCAATSDCRILSRLSPASCNVQPIGRRTRPREPTPETRDAQASSCNDDSGRDPRQGRAGGAGAGELAGARARAGPDPDRGGGCRRQPARCHAAPGQLSRRRRAIRRCRASKSPARSRRSARASRAGRSATRSARCSTAAAMRSTRSRRRRRRCRCRRGCR